MNEADVYQRLAGKVNFPKSKFIRQVLRKLVTPDEGEMLLALPAPLSELAQKFQMDEAMVEQKLDEFVRKGVCMPLEKEGVLRHFCVNNIIQVHDATIHATINKKYEPVQDEIVRLWQNFRETEWFEMVRMREEFGGSQGRVAPLRGAIEDTSQLLPYEDVAAIIEEAGIDCIEITGGIYENPDSTSKKAIRKEEDEAYFLPHAEALRSAVSIPLILVGGFRTPGVVERVLEEGTADMVSVCRPLIREPLLIKRWKEGDLEKATCISCNQCTENVFTASLRCYVEEAERAKAG